MIFMSMREKKKPERKDGKDNTSKLPEKRVGNRKYDIAPPEYYLRKHSRKIGRKVTEKILGPLTDRSVEGIKKRIVEEIFTEGLKVKVAEHLGKDVADTTAEDLIKVVDSAVAEEKKPSSKEELEAQRREMRRIAEHYDEELWGLSPEEKEKITHFVIRLTDLFFPKKT